MRLCVSVGLALWLLLAGGEVQAGQGQVAGGPATQLSSDAGLARVRSSRTETYQSVLADFDAAMRVAPADVGLAVARCGFIGNFTDEEDSEWIEAATDDFDRCSKAIQANWPKAPQAQLFALDQRCGKEAIAFGEPLVSAADHWPAALRRQLFVKLSQSYRSQGNTQRAGELALVAARIGEPSCVASAAEYLIGKHEFVAAQTLLLGAPPADDQWEATRRVSAALNLQNRHAARDELLRYRDSDFDVGAVVAARAYLQAGDLQAARSLLGKDRGTSKKLQQARFDVALAAADMRGAAMLVDMGDMEGIPDNAQRFALLATRAPGTLLLAPMLRSASLLLLILAAMSLFVGLLFVPVHYRGLARRIQGRAPTPLFADIGLPRAWLALVIFLCAPLLAAIVAEPHAVSSLLGGENAMQPGTLFRAIAWGTALGIVCLVPLVRGIGMDRLIGDRAALRGSWRILVAWALLIGVGAAVALLNRHAGDTQTVQTRMIDSLVGGGLGSYGLGATLLVVAVLVPIFEETGFRGLLLGGLTRHISFGWANTAQAALFAAVHNDLPRFPFYFAMGLLAGWLVKRTRALGPAMGLHMLNNALAVLIRYWQ